MVIYSIQKENMWRAFDSKRIRGVEIVQGPRNNRNILNITVY